MKEPTPTIAVGLTVLFVAGFGRAESVTEAS
jgi:energy-converting hydrogenase Eha subunit A